MHDRKPFAYTYTSPERKDIDLPEADTQTDAKAGWKAVRIAVIWGVVSCLVFGFGLTCALEWARYGLAFVFGAVGIAGMAFTPAFHQKLCRKKQKIK